jgi:hypothetical protein
MEAENHVGLLWVTVKGYPKGTLKTNPSTQVVHWLNNAFFDSCILAREKKRRNIGYRASGLSALLKAGREGPVDSTNDTLFVHMG